MLSNERSSYNEDDAQLRLAAAKLIETSDITTLRRLPPDLLHWRMPAM